MLLSAPAPTIIAMSPDSIIAHRLFVDGNVRPVFHDDAGHQYVLDHDGLTRLYGAWLPERDEADAPLVVPVASRRPLR